MSQVTLSEKGIGPFEYNGYNYYVAPANTRVLRQWKTSLTAPSGTSSASDGIVNTNSMNNADHPAARYTRSLGPEWYLPARHELNNVVYQNRAEIDEADTTSGTKLADIGSGWVWSSTEYSGGYAWLQRFSDGHNASYYKVIEYWVVGVHKEPIT